MTDTTLSTDDWSIQELCRSDDEITHRTRTRTRSADRQTGYDSTQ